MIPALVVNSLICTFGLVTAILAIVEHSRQRIKKDAKGEVVSLVVLSMGLFVFILSFTILINIASTTNLVAVPHLAK